MYVFEKNNGFFQALHPVTIFIYLGLMLTGTIMINHPIILGGFMVILVLALIVDGSIKNWLKSLKIYLYMIAIYMLINLVVNNLGATVLWMGPVLPVIGRLTVSLENLVYSLVMGLRLIIVFSAFVLLNRVLDPDQTLTVFARVFPRSALLVALTAKTIPYMSQQLQRVAEIQQCRGVQYYTGSYLSRLRNRLPLIKVLLLSSLEDSFNLGESIQARAYGSGPRSSYYTLSFKLRDVIVIVCSWLAFGAMVWSITAGWAAVEFYPVLGNIFAPGGQCLVMVAMILLLMLPVTIAWRWEKWDNLRLKI